MNTQATPTDSQEVNPLYEAYVRWKPAYDALPKEALLQSLNVDITNVVTMVRGSVKRIMALKAQCIEELPKADASVFDVLESQALGLSYAQGRHQSAKRPSLPLPDLSARGAQTHDILSTGIAFAIKRGLLSPQMTRDLRGPVGYKNLASDLVALVALYRDNDAQLAGRTGVTKEDVDEAESLAYQLLGAIGEREHQSVTVAETSDARQRAFTLFMTTLDRVRRIVHYLRWHEGDADQIAPSAYAGRKRGKDSDLLSEEPPDQTGSAGDAAHSTVSDKAAPASVPEGMPGASPYVSAE